MQEFYGRRKRRHGNSVMERAGGPVWIGSTSTRGPDGVNVVQSVEARGTKRGQTQAAFRKLGELKEAMRKLKSRGFMKKR